jgi:membrane associated rhomboid family serine protease
MFIPIGDTPNPRGTPYVNYTLIGVNIAVFLFISFPLTLSRPDLYDPLLLEYLEALGARGAIPVQAIYQHISAYDLFVFRYGYRPADPSVMTLFTAMFLHGGWLHLAGNMLFLWIFGDNVEARLGRVRYLLAYLATGLAATFFFAVFVPDSQVPMIGASGAISGVLGFYFLWFPRNQVRTFIFLFPFIITTVLIPARVVLGIYLVISNILPFIADFGAESGVAHGAHIGGFLAGVLIAFVANRMPGDFAFRKGEEKETQESSGVDRVRRSLRMGNVGQATLRFLSLSPAQQGSLATSDLLSMGEYLLDRRDYHGALTIFRRLISERPKDPELDRAYLGAGKAALRLSRNTVTARDYFLTAIDVARSDEIVEAARQNLRALQEK